MLDSRQQTICAKCGKMHFIWLKYDHDFKPRKVPVDQAYTGNLIESLLETTEKTLDKAYRK